MIERRKYARLKIEISAKYRIIGHKNKAGESAECSNISPEGLCLLFRGNVDIASGNRLEIEIGLPGSKPFIMIGEVIWLKSAEAAKGKAAGALRAGIKILEIHNHDENRFLLQLCDRMVQKLNKDYPTLK